MVAAGWTAVTSSSARNLLRAYRLSKRGPICADSGTRWDSPVALYTLGVLM